MIESLFAIVILLSLTGLGLGLYFLPAIVAWRRGHNNLLAIAMTTLLLGWLIVPWIAALIWSTTDNRRTVSA